jgi:hypothetical protein
VAPRSRPRCGGGGRVAARKLAFVRRVLLEETIPEHLVAQLHRGGLDLPRARRSDPGDAVPGDRPLPQLGVLLGALKTRLPWPPTHFELELASPLGAPSLRGRHARMVLHVAHDADVDHRSLAAHRPSATSEPLPQGLVAAIDPRALERRAVPLLPRHTAVRRTQPARPGPPGAEAKLPVALDVGDTALHLPLAQLAGSEPQALADPLSGLLVPHRLGIRPATHPRTPRFVLPVVRRSIGQRHALLVERVVGLVARAFLLLGRDATGADPVADPALRTLVLDVDDLAGLRAVAAGTGRAIVPGALHHLAAPAVVEESGAGVGIGDGQADRTGIRVARGLQVVPGQRPGRRHGEQHGCQGQHDAERGGPPEAGVGTTRARSH